MNSTKLEHGHRMIRAGSPYILEGYDYEDNDVPLPGMYVNFPTIAVH